MKREIIIYISLSKKLLSTPHVARNYYLHINISNSQPHTEITLNKNYIQPSNINSFLYTYLISPRAKSTYTHRYKDVFHTSNILYSVCFMVTMEL
jgi:hypothetical protein